MALPSTKAGMMVTARLARQFSNSGTYPEAGSQPSSIENRKISMMPSQKFGVEMPHSANRLAP